MMNHLFYFVALSCAINSSGDSGTKEIPFSPPLFVYNQEGKELCAMDFCNNLCKNDSSLNGKINHQENVL